MKVRTRLNHVHENVRRWHHAREQSTLRVLEQLVAKISKADDWPVFMKLAAAAVPVHLSGGKFLCRDTYATVVKYRTISELNKYGWGEKVPVDLTR